MIEARFVHVNIVARDWRALAAWYERVLGCVPVPPERDLRGPVVEAGTGVADAALRGIHLRLPGLALEAGPTLEIYECAPSLEAAPPVANRPGFAHIAFAVDSVEAAREVVLREGGSAVGSVVTTQTTDGRRVTWTYVADPEGNIVELQAWSG